MSMIKDVATAHAISQALGAVCEELELNQEDRDRAISAFANAFHKVMTTMSGKEHRTWDEFKAIKKAEEEGH